MQWSRDVSVLPSVPRPLHSTQPPVQLLSCAACSVLVYSNGDVGVVGGGVCSLAPRMKDWTFCTASVSCDRTVCVVGASQEDISIGIAESAEGKLKQPLVSRVQSKGAELASSCVCGEKLLLLCKYPPSHLFPLICLSSLFPSLSHFSSTRRAYDDVVGATFASLETCCHISDTFIPQTPPHAVSE